MVNPCSSVSCTDFFLVVFASIFFFNLLQQCHILYNTLIDSVLRCGIEVALVARKSKKRVSKCRFRVKTCYLGVTRYSVPRRVRRRMRPSMLARIRPKVRRSPLGMAEPARRFTSAKMAVGVMNCPFSLSEGMEKHSWK